MSSFLTTSISLGTEIYAVEASPCFAVIKAAETLINKHINTAVGIQLQHPEPFVYNMQASDITVESEQSLNSAEYADNLPDFLPYTQSPLQC